MHVCIVHTLFFFSLFFYYYKNLHYRLFCCYTDKWQTNARPDQLFVLVIFKQGIMYIQPDVITE